MLSRLAFEDLDGVARAELHDRLLPVGATAHGLAHALFLTALVGRPDARDLHAEELLDRLADLRLRRVGMNFERVFAALLISRRGLLGDERADDGTMDRRHLLLPSLLLRRRSLRRRRLLI